MLHDSDLASVHEVRNEVDEAREAGQSGKARGQEQVDCVVDAGARLESSIRDTVAGGVDRVLAFEKPATVAACACSKMFVSPTPFTPFSDFVCENVVLTDLAQDGKILVGTGTAVKPHAGNPAARYNVPVPAQW